MIKPQKWECSEEDYKVGEDVVENFFNFFLKILKFFEKFEIC